MLARCGEMGNLYNGKWWYMHYGKQYGSSPKVINRTTILQFYFWIQIYNIDKQIYIFERMSRYSVVPQFINAFVIELYIHIFERMYSYTIVPWFVNAFVVNSIPGTKK